MNAIEEFDRKVRGKDEQRGLNEYAKDCLSRGDLTPVMEHIRPEEKSAAYMPEEKQQILDRIAEKTGEERTDSETLLEEAMKYGTRSEAFPIKRSQVKDGEYLLIRDLATTYLNKELGLHSGRRWEPAPLGKDFRPERLGEYIRLGKACAQYVKNEIIGRDLLRPDVEFTDPIRDRADYYAWERKQKVDRINGWCAEECTEENLALAPKSEEGLETMRESLWPEHRWIDHTPYLHMVAGLSPETQKQALSVMDKAIESYVGENGGYTARPEDRDCMEEVKAALAGEKLLRECERSTRLVKAAEIALDTAQHERVIDEYHGRQTDPAQEADLIREVTAREIRKEILLESGFPRRRVDCVMEQLPEEGWNKGTALLVLAEEGPTAAQRYKMLYDEIKPIAEHYQRIHRECQHWRDCGVPRETTDLVLAGIDGNLSKANGIRVRARETSEKEMRSMEKAVRLVQKGKEVSVYEAPKRFLTKVRPLWDKDPATKDRKPEEVIQGFRPLCTTYRFSSAQEGPDNVLENALGGMVARSGDDGSIYRRMRNEIYKQTVVKEVEGIARSLEKGRGAAAEKQKGVER